MKGTLEGSKGLSSFPMVFRPRSIEMGPHHGRASVEDDAGEAEGREYVGGVACQIGKIFPLASGFVVPMTITGTSRRLSQ